VFFGFLPLAVVAFRKDVIHRDQVRHLPHFLVMAVLATAFYYFAIAEGGFAALSIFTYAWCAAASRPDPAGNRR
jgi:hypothetical protein